MSYKVISVFRVIIASPSDTQEIRDGLYERMLIFNFRDSEDKEFIFQPLLWERHAPASSGREAQEVLDDLLVRKSDVLLGIFRHKFGNPAGNHASGTVHEIETFANPESGFNPGVLFVRDKSKIKDVSERRKITAYEKELQGRKFLTGKYGSVTEGIENGFASILYQAEQLKAELLALEAGTADSRPIEPSKARKVIEIEESARDGRLRPVESEDMEAVDAMPSLSGALEESKGSIAARAGLTSAPLLNWSDGLRLALPKETRERMNQTNASIASLVFKSMDKEQRERIQEFTRSLGSYAYADLNASAKASVKAAMDANGIFPPAQGFRMMVSTNMEVKQWLLEHTDSTSVVVHSLKIIARTADDEPLETVEEMKLEMSMGEGEMFGIPLPEHRGFRLTDAEAIIDYTRRGEQRRKGRLEVE